MDSNSSKASVCDLPPAGWHCTRPKGHEGPCAAAPVTLTFSESEELDHHVATAPEFKAVPKWEIKQHFGLPGTEMFGTKVRCAEKRWFTIVSFDEEFNERTAREIIEDHQGRAEVEAILEALGAHAIRVREGGGQENIYASLAVSVAALRRKLEQAKVAITEQFIAQAKYELEGQKYRAQIAQLEKDKPAPPSIIP